MITYKIFYDEHCNLVNNEMFFELWSSSARHVHWYTYIHTLNQQYLLICGHLDFPFSPRKKNVVSHFACLN